MWENWGMGRSGGGGGGGAAASGHYSWPLRPPPHPPFYSPTRAPLHRITPARAPNISTPCCGVQSSTGTMTFLAISVVPAALILCAMTVAVAAVVAGGDNKVRSSDIPAYPADIPPFLYLWQHLSSPSCRRPVTAVVNGLLTHARLYRYHPPSPPLNPALLPIRAITLLVWAHPMQTQTPEGFSQHATTLYSSLLASSFRQLTLPSGRSCHCSFPMGVPF